MTAVDKKIGLAGVQEDGLEDPASEEVAKPRIGVRRFPRRVGARRRPPFPKRRMGQDLGHLLADDGPWVDAALSTTLLLLEAGRVRLTTSGIRQDLLDKPVGDRAKRRLLRFRRRLHAVSGKGFEIPEPFLGRANPALDREPLFLVAEEWLSIRARQHRAEDEAAVDGLPQARAPRRRVLRSFGNDAVEFAAMVTFEVPDGNFQGVHAVVQVQDTMKLFEG
ncbi:hypothetical protein PG984_013800 [Apiospora sp. TS-2023a]